MFDPRNRYGRKLKDVIHLGRAIVYVVGVANRFTDMIIQSP
jgi:hypothetical protein